MGLLLDVPQEVGMFVALVVGAAAGSLANWAIYTFRLQPTCDSPWSRGYRRHGSALWLDRLPVFGWLRARPRVEAPGGWWRPLLVELGNSTAWAMLLPDLSTLHMLGPQVASVLLSQFVAQTLLVTLMIAVSLIDFDDQIIPDELTVPGALGALLLIVLLPGMALTDDVIRNEQGINLLSLDAASPSRWPSDLDQPLGLSIGMACFVVWCMGLLPRSWYGRHGWRRAVGLWIARLVRAWQTRALLALSIVGCGLIAAVWHFGLATRWQPLLSSLMGLAVGGGIIWSIRVAGYVALRREAMGFGDVTLMAMIGAFLGWQPCLFVLVLAAFCGLIGGVFQLVMRRADVIPFGPFLCLGAAGTIVWWPRLWASGHRLFIETWLVPTVLGLCFVFLVLSLSLLQVVKSWFAR